jgi:DNA-binding LacI/PurR family transcriptional regulator
LGEEAVNAMMRMIDQPEGSPAGEIVVPTELILRETCVRRIVPGQPIAAVVPHQGA